MCPERLIVAAVCAKGGPQGKNGVSVVVVVSVVVSPAGLAGEFGFGLAWLGLAYGFLQWTEEIG